MALTCGLIGLPTVGKTTFFNLLTHQEVATSNFFSGKTEANVGTATIPDQRIDYLSAMFKPKKTTYAQLEVTDVVGLVRGASEGKGAGNAFLSAVRNVDTLIQILRVFDSNDVLHVDGSIDPLRDLETVNLELWLADLEMVEKRIDRIKSGKKITAENQAELKVLEKLRSGLEEEKGINQLELSEEESRLVRSFAFLTEKPMILVVNLDEAQLLSGDYPQKEALQAYASQKGLPVLEICAKTEMEIGQLSDEDQAAFMAELGIAESGMNRLARAMYQSLGLISFLTAGEDEVKAWTINKGIDAKRAAGKIHSDIERGFIRAEVVGFSVLQELGSMSKVKEKGLFRLEGKDYIVQDGDIINFRFNV